MDGRSTAALEHQGGDPGTTPVSKQEEDGRILAEQTS